MNSHYGEYVKERLGKLCFECEHGFAVYWYPVWNQKEVVYIEEIYVDYRYRKEGVARWMADQIAEEARGKGVTRMLGSVNPKANGATQSVKVLLGYGMELDSIHDGLIMFTKDLEEV